MSVSIRDARGSRTDRDWIERVYREYLDDLSAGNTGLFPALTETGHREPDLLITWFRDERSVPFVILRGGSPVGFARVLCSRPPSTAAPPMGRGGTGALPATADAPQFHLVDFFVQLPHRGHGVGRHAATLVFSRFAGQWLVTEEARNPGTVAFWRKVVAGYSRGRYAERTVGAEVRHTFVSPGPAAATRP